MAWGARDGDDVIPNLGLGDVGPFVVLFGSLLTLSLVAFAAVPWTIGLDWPHLRTRSRLTVAVLVVGLVAAALAAFAPYEAPDGRRCPSAVPTYGFGLEALATLDGGEDVCAVPGQLLVVLAMAVVLGAIIGGVLWWSSPDPVLDADDPAH